MRGDFLVDVPLNLSTSQLAKFAVVVPWPCAKKLVAVSQMYVIQGENQAGQSGWSGCARFERRRFPWEIDSYQPVRRALFHIAV